MHVGGVRSTQDERYHRLLPLVVTQMLSWRTTFGNEFLKEMPP